MSNHKRQSDDLASKAKNLLNELTRNKGSVFSCRDESLRYGHFERISRIDAIPRHINSKDKIDDLLKARAIVRLKLRIAERLLDEVEHTSRDYGTMV